MGVANRIVRIEPAERRPCQLLADTLARIGDKWTVLVVGVLACGPLRYNQIRRSIEGISQRMLTLTLRGLQQDGLVTRTVFPTVPPRVDYELTDLGRTLIEPLKALYGWAEQHRLEMEAARQRFGSGDGQNALEGRSARQ